MNKNPLVSIIIPVYNDAEFLHESLDSAVNQTLKDIEIICVNDASTDNSLEIMNEYAEKDKRVRIINKLQNGGTLMARKDGVMAARGGYTIFLDGDDYLFPNACETAYNLILKNDVDILWYSFAVHNYNEDGSVENIKVYDPSGGDFLCGRGQIQDDYFTVNQAYSMNLYNKIYKTELLQLAQSKIDDFYCCSGEDRYAMYHILYYASTMKRAVTEPLYIYRYGKGQSSSYRKMSIEKFEQYCYQRSILKGKIIKFLEREGTLEEHKKYLSCWRFTNLKINCSVLARRINPEEFNKAVKILYHYFNEKNDIHEIIFHSLTMLRNHISRAANLEKTNKNLLAKIQMNNEKNNDVCNIILHSLTELRNRINQAANLEKTNKNLLTKIQIDNENKTARINELQDWSKEQLKAKEWFLSQIKSKDERIAELEKVSGFCYKILTKIFRILRGKN